MRVHSVQESVVWVMKGVVIFAGKLVENSIHLYEYLSAEFRLLCSTPPLFMSLHSWDCRDGAHSSESNSMT